MLLGETLLLHERTTPVEGSFFSNSRGSWWNGKRLLVALQEVRVKTNAVQKARKEDK